MWSKLWWYTLQIYILLQSIYLPSIKYIYVACDWEILVLKIWLFNLTQSPGFWLQELGTHYSSRSCYKLSMYQVWSICHMWFTSKSPKSMDINFDLETYIFDQLTFIPQHELVRAHDSCVRLEELLSKLVSHAYLIFKNRWDISCFAALVTFGDFQQGFTNFVCLTWSAVISVTQMSQSCHHEVNTSEVMKQNITMSFPSL